MSKRTGLVERRVGRSKGRRLCPEGTTRLRLREAGKSRVRRVVPEEGVAALLVLSVTSGSGELRRRRSSVAENVAGVRSTATHRRRRRGDAQRVRAVVEDRVDGAQDEKLQAVLQEHRADALKEYGFRVQSEQTGLLVGRGGGVFIGPRP